jgi:hypothetical protein
MSIAKCFYGLALARVNVDYGVVCGRNDVERTGVLVANPNRIVDVAFGLGDHVLRSWHKAAIPGNDRAFSIEFFSASEKLGVCILINVSRAGASVCLKETYS